MKFAKYRRMSEEKLEPEDQALAMLRQDEDNEYLARSNGATETVDFCDPDISAYKRNVWRPAFEKMLEELPKMDGLVAYDLDRLTRDPAVLERLIAIYERNPHLRFYTMSPDEMDLSTEQGRETARYAVLAARKESRRNSERQVRRHKQRREMGKLSGGYRPFGVAEDRRSLNMTEVALIRQAATDLLSGKAIYAIVDEWNALGVMTAGGKPFSRTVLRNMLLSPRMAGYLVQHPAPRDEGVPAKPRHQWIAVSEKTGKPLMANLPPILADDPADALALWQLVCEELAGRRKPQSFRPGNRAKYLLSGLVVCGVCAGPMRGMWVKAKDRHNYACSDGCVSVHGPELDTYVSSVMLDHWSNAPTIVPAVEPFPFAEEVLDLADRSDALEVAFATGRFAVAGGDKADEVARYLAAKEAVMSLLRPLLKQQREWQRAHVAPVAVNTLDVWSGADVAHRRVMIRRELQRVVVNRVPRGRRPFDPARADLQWRA